MLNPALPGAQTQPKTTTKKTPRKLGETQCFQKGKSSCRPVLLHDDIAIPAKCSKWLQVVEGGGSASSQSWTRVVSWFTYVHVDEAAQGRSSSNTCVVATIQARNGGKVIVSCIFRAQEGSKRILEENHSIPLWPETRPRQRWKKSLGQYAVLLWATVCGMPHVLCFDVTGKRDKKPGVRDWHQCELKRML